MNNGLYNMKTWELLTTRWELFVLLIVFVTAGTKVWMALQYTTTSFAFTVPTPACSELYSLVLRTSCSCVSLSKSAWASLSKALVTCHSCLLIWTVTLNTQKRYWRVVKVKNLERLSVSHWLVLCLWNSLCSYCL